MLDRLFRNLSLIALVIATAAATYVLTRPEPPASGETQLSASKKKSSTVKRGPRGKQGPKGKRGPTGPRGIQGAQGDPGPAGANANDYVRGITINWRNGASDGRDSGAVDMPGLGTLSAVCNAGSQAFTISPATGAARTVVVSTTFQGAGTQGAASTVRQESQGNPITVALPVNGMLQLTISQEPVNGDGGPGPAPASVTASSESKLNGFSASENFCYVAAQVLENR